MSTRRDHETPVVDEVLSDVPRKTPHEAVPGDVLVEALPDGGKRRHNIVRLERPPNASNGDRRLVFEPIPNATTYLTPEEVEREGRLVVEDPNA